MINALYKVVPAMFQPTFQYLTHNPVLAGHSREREIYHTLPLEYYWTQREENLYQKVKDCQTCPEEGKSYRHQRPLKLFPTTGQLQLVAINIAEPFPKSSQGNQFGIFITDRYSNLSRAILGAKVTVLHVALVFLIHRVIPYGMPGYLLFDDKA